MIEDLPFALPEPVPLAVPMFVILVLAEVVAWKRGAALRYETRDALASLAMGIGNLASKLVVAGVFAAVYAFVWTHRLLDLGHAWWVFVLAFFAEDMSYYWFHRLAHERRWLWASHVNHHTSQHYNLTTALRQPVFSIVSLSFAFWLPMVWLGVHPAIVVFFQGISLVYQFWIHTEAIGRMGPLEWVFNTPSHHRVHHAVNPRYLDANYAGVLIVWDRLFGTFVEEVPEDPPRYGVVKQLGTHNPLWIWLHEWIAIGRDLVGARSVREVLGYTWGPPGWSPDGSRMTTTDLKARWARVHPEEG